MLYKETTARIIRTIRVIRTVRTAKEGELHMNVHELNRDQLVQLKQSYLCAKYRNISYGELATADDIVTDEEVFLRYDGANFTEDDFS